MGKQSIVTYECLPLAQIKFITPSIHQIALTPLRKPYRIRKWLLFIHMNTERLFWRNFCSEVKLRRVDLESLERGIWDRFCATLWYSLNRY